VRVIAMSGPLSLTPVANGFALPLTGARSPYLRLGPPIFTQDIYYVIPNVGGHVLRT
jgi:hypothetical protein